MKESNKIILKTLIFLIFFAIALPALSNTAIAGLPGPEGITSWYIPNDFRDNKLDPSPYFPAISQYSDSMNYTRRTTMTAWYFDDYENLVKGENELCRYLKEHGKISSDTVDITEELQEYENNRPILGSTNLTVTRFESANTSGYFAVMIKPFGDGLENYFIIYYGTNEKPLSEQIDTVKKLMAKGYYMGNKNGYVRGLNDSITQASAFPVTSYSSAYSGVFERIAALSQYGLENCTNPESPIYDPSVVNAYGRVPLIHNGSQLNEFADKLRIIRENSWNEIEFYPNGSIVRYGSGTSRGYFWIELYDKGDEEYSENDTREIYDIVEEYAVENGIEDIPVVFTLTNETQIIGFTEFPVYWYDVDNIPIEEFENLNKSVNDTGNSSSKDSKNIPASGLLTTCVLIGFVGLIIKK